MIETDRRVADLERLLAVLVARNGGRLTFSDAELEKVRETRPTIAYYPDHPYHRVIVEVL